MCIFLRPHFYFSVAQVRILVIKLAFGSAFGVVLGTREAGAQFPIVPVGIAEQRALFDVDVAGRSVVADFFARFVARHLLAVVPTFDAIEIGGTARALVSRTVRNVAMHSGPSFRIVTFALSAFACSPSRANLAAGQTRILRGGAAAFVPRPAGFTYTRAYPVSVFRIAFAVSVHGANSALSSVGSVVETILRRALTPLSRNLTVGNDVTRAKVIRTCPVSRANLGRLHGVDAIVAVRSRRRTVWPRKFATFAEIISEAKTNAARKVSVSVALFRIWDHCFHAVEIALHFGVDRERVVVPLSSNRHIAFSPRFSV